MRSESEKCRRKSCGRVQRSRLWQDYTPNSIQYSVYPHTYEIDRSTILSIIYLSIYLSSLSFLSPTRTSARPLSVSRSGGGGARAVTAHHHGGPEWAQLSLIGGCCSPTRRSRAGCDEGGHAQGGLRACRWPRFSWLCRSSLAATRSWSRWRCATTSTRSSSRSTATSAPASCFSAPARSWASASRCSRATGCSS